MELATNRQAKRDYEILDTLEAGLVLTGQEVKSVRAGLLKLQGSYATIARGELWLIGAHLPAYKPAGPLPDYDPARSRKLLVHRRELNHLIGKIQERGLTLVPLRVYTRRALLKIELGLGRGRKQYEKRELIKKRDLDRELRERMKREA
jgi:SsrA-binding protein